MLLFAASKYSIAQHKMQIFFTDTLPTSQELQRIFRHEPYATLTEAQRRRRNTISRKTGKTMQRIFAIAILAIFSIVAPAHAAYSSLGYYIDLRTPIGDDLAGDIFLIKNDILTTPLSYTYSLGGNLTLNGMQLTDIYNPPGGPSIFAVPGRGPLFLGVNLADVPNLTYADFFATSGTVRLTSIDDSPVPLPATLPLFGIAFAGLGGAGWIKRQQKVLRHPG